MFLDLTKIITTPETSINFSFTEGPSEIENCGKQFFLEKPFEIVGVASNNGGSLSLDCTFKASMKTLCDRCLKEITVPLSVSFTEQLVKEGVVSDEATALVGTKVDFSEILMKNILMQLEMKYLCKADCKGICQFCGTDLNLGTCTCNQKSIDPRLEKLAELLK